MYLETHCRPNNNDRKMTNVEYKFKKIANGFIPGTCPLSQILSLLQIYISQSCGKCVPCRNGLKQVEKMLKSIIEFNANEDTYTTLKDLSKTIYQTADCATGYEAAHTILVSLDLFKSEYDLHVYNKRCSSYNLDCPPCTSYCPANVDIPGYISLISKGRFDDAVRVIRNNNPFVTTCAYVCEHPCEIKCRRHILDDAINIKGLKRYAIDNAKNVKPAKTNVKTGKKINIVGAGPAGLTCAYYLALMGHKVKIYEANKKLGGMLQYGIPNYRLPKKKLANDIEAIINHKNIKVKTGIKVGRDISFDSLKSKCDAMYVAIGAQDGKMIPLPGIKSKGVYSAVEVLKKIGDKKVPSYKDKKVVVIGGGNVAMDMARTAVRCKAKKVTVVYRRRQKDMTALEDEVHAAMEEGVELLTLYAPKGVKKDKSGRVKSLVATPQMVSLYDRGGRPRTIPANKPDIKIDCDVVLLAIGQNIVIDHFKDFGIDERRKVLIVNKKYSSNKHANVFAGGDCVSGPSTVIEAVAAGRTAAENIDEYLGYHHKYKEKIDIPKANVNFRDPIGRSEINLVPVSARKKNFKAAETGLTDMEAMQECKRCLRCDVYGCNHVD